MMNKVIEDFLKADEIARKIYYHKFKKYVGLIYLLAGAYAPLTEAVILILKVSSLSTMSYILTGMFIAVLIPIFFINDRLLRLHGIISKMNKIIYKRSIYDQIYDIVMKILFVLVILGGILYHFCNFSSLVAFWILELWLLYTFFHLKFKMRVEDWVAMISPIGLILQAFTGSLMIIFVIGWITAGIISLVRAYGKF
ncbi:hypothetical protein Ahos_0307 [Acidianus hospitalis W1]|uniref:Uncharacterized protein n=1 Tax=Acidianus hospitalis (strain W1) TaxID=933801 RepID=F4B5A4_ACIHW|nr:hypothetical protein [Acidianus hospitalis]AEE93198.1 hypothetical protein Ahos_0307 [Acidianus hospitalis W1]